ncbi:hypothetical protein SDC9_162795 [bioreactor metagenome]|uniref:Uncharacterized protein n=1 Tax=bioreactor metagenome TaxID=1076179 RepID=A0A645FM39_9ZZZZ
MHRQKVGAVFHDIGNGQQQQNGCQQAAQGKAKIQGYGQHGEHHSPQINHSGAAFSALPQRLSKQVPAHMPGRPLSPLGQLNGQQRGLPLPHAPLFRQTAHLLAVAAAGVVVHMGVDPRRVLLKRLLHSAGALQKRGEVIGAQQPVSLENAGHALPQILLLLGLPGVLQHKDFGAQRQQLLQQSQLKGRDQKGKLLLGQRKMPPEAMEQSLQPGGGEVSDGRVQHNRR